MTSRPAARRKSTDSPIIARFSSAVAPRTSTTWSSQLLPKMVVTGVSAAIRARRFGSSSARLARWRVDPNAASLACRKVMLRAAAKNSSSFGFDPGQPPSMYGKPASSRRRAIFSLSASDRTRPSRCVPSRRVVSYRTMGGAVMPAPPLARRSAAEQEPGDRLGAVRPTEVAGARAVLDGCGRRPRRGRRRRRPRRG